MIELKRLEINDIKLHHKKLNVIHQNEFFKVQSLILTDIYKRYNYDLDSANIVLYYAKNLHHKILRERDSDLDFDISFENFWNNHSNIKQTNHKVIDISKETGLPKETARRKIQELLKNKILKKDLGRIYWEPIEKDKNSYNLMIDNHIKNITRLIFVFSTSLKIDLNSDIIKKEIKKNFSFYWYHFLKTEITYFQLWNNYLQDLELHLIALECSIQSSFVKKDINNSISSSSISNITGIPRATCIRKLEKLIDLRLVKKDKLNKRYFLDPVYFNSNNSVKKINMKIEDLFSNFYLIVIKALKRQDIIELK